MSHRSEPILTEKLATPIHGDQGSTRGIQWGNHVEWEAEAFTSFDSLQK